MDDNNYWHSGEFAPDAENQEWTELKIGGLTVRSSPQGGVNIYEMSDLGLLSTMGNSPDQDWAELDVNMDKDARVLVSNVSMRVPKAETEPDGWYYVSMGYDEADQEPYPSIEFRIHPHVALYLFAALYSVLEGETE
jgi:hypothetical protein